ncbi:hypothetical protein N7462_002684 [Penicillium macrosclerotiorum]|uniref:uncharacterized protein n=1 Tax=Penicillium macrosclerotiorum TaxID=303699 RepID=UPI0025498075|nr:uncharacterized protein N7462_002684 [Penicillium macrosclerotiorum]KAJ5693261.1 hypothetical protein N7462_002684 [Penicillium macrosclerotiorum]
MINPAYRFFSSSQVYFGLSEIPGVETHWDVWDWNQLRLIKIKGTNNILPPDADVELRVSSQFADYLSPTVCAITVDDDGLLTGISTDIEDDDTNFIAYLPFSVLTSLENCRIADCRTIKYSELQEVDRLGPGVDLSFYVDEFGSSRKVAFKFEPAGKPLRLQMAWNELNLLALLPPHPNLVPLDRVVLEDTESRVIGFTTKYISGGTLADHPEIPLRFEWLKQLTQVVDFLNLELGVMHQDIAPRNLLIDPDTSGILLFDFNWAFYGESLLEGRDDVSNVVYTLYELVTNDTHFSSIPYEDRNIDISQGSEWTCKRELDSDISKFRNFLNEWVTRRKSNESTRIYCNPPNRLTWPEQPTPLDYSVPFELGETDDGEPFYATGPRLRRTAIGKGQYCFRWERPPQSRLGLGSSNR